MILLFLEKRDETMKDKIPNKVLKEIFPKKVKKLQISQKIYDQLKKMILSGKLKKGQRLVQEKLAHDFNVSRMPIVVALRRLRKDGLVIWKDKKGSFVA